MVDGADRIKSCQIFHFSGRLKFFAFSWLIVLSWGSSWTFFLWNFYKQTWDRTNQKIKVFPPTCSVDDICNQPQRLLNVDFFFCLSCSLLWGWESHSSAFFYLSFWEVQNSTEWLSSCHVVPGLDRLQYCTVYSPMCDW